MSIAVDALSKISRGQLATLLVALFHQDPSLVYSPAALEFMNDPEVLAAFKAAYPEGK